MGQGTGVDNRVHGYLYTIIRFGCGSFIVPVNAAPGTRNGRGRRLSLARTGATSNIQKMIVGRIVCGHFRNAPRDGDWPLGDGNMKKIYVCLLLVVVAAGGIVFCCGRSGKGVGHSKPLTKAEEMERLIERLADVYKKPITIGGEAVIYRPKEDKTVTQEILDNGFDAVPALIKGLNHKKYLVAIECAVLLRNLPRNSGVSALVQSLSHEDMPPSFQRSVHISLHCLIGTSSYAPPGGVDKPDVEEIKKIWLPWWAANKDKLVDTNAGIGLNNEDGTITPLPLGNK